jgi:hypothetical protein
MCSSVRAGCRIETADGCVVCVGNSSIGKNREPYDKIQPYDPTRCPRWIAPWNHVHPIHHWTTLELHLPSRTVKWYDSLKSEWLSMDERNKVCERIQAMFQFSKANGTTNGGIDKWELDKEWQFEQVADLPAQVNGDDCGACTCVTVERLVRERPHTVVWH